MIIKFQIFSPQIISAGLTTKKRFNCINNFWSVNDSSQCYQQYIKVHLWGKYTEQITII